MILILQLRVGLSVIRIIIIVFYYYYCILINIAVHSNIIVVFVLV